MSQGQRASSFVVVHGGSFATIPLSVKQSVFQHLYRYPYRYLYCACLSCSLGFADSRLTDTVSCCEGSTNSGNDHRGEEPTISSSNQATS